MKSQSTIILTESDITSLLKALIEKKSKTYLDNPGSRVKINLDITKAYTDTKPGFGYEDYDTSEETTYYEAEFNGVTYSIINGGQIILEKTLTVTETLENLISVIYPDSKGERFDYKIRVGTEWTADDKLYIHISNSKEIDLKNLIKNIK